MGRPRAIWEVATATLTNACNPSTCRKEGSHAHSLGYPPRTVGARCGLNKSHHKFMIEQERTPTVSQP